MTARHLVSALAGIALAAATTGAQQRPAQAQPERARQQEPAGTQQRVREPVRGGEWLGAAGPGSVDNIGLSQMQVRQLQRALDAQGCSPGPIDGLLGPGTRRAIECVQQRYDLAGEDPDELLRVLNVGFTLPDRRGAAPAQPRQGVTPQPGIAPRAGEDRTDPTRVEDRRDPARTEIRADTGRTPRPTPQRLPADTGRIPPPLR